MKINAKQPSIKAYTLSHFKIGDVCMGVRDEHYYLVVKSEKKETNRGFNRKRDYKRCRIYEIYTCDSRT